MKTFNLVVHSIIKIKISNEMKKFMKIIENIFKNHIHLYLERCSNFLQDRKFAPIKKAKIIIKIWLSQEICIAG